MSNRPTPDKPAPGENDRTIVDKPTEPILENDATIKNDPNTGEFAATIKDGAAGGSRSKTELSAESRFGRYEVRRELGRGAMGAVYLALDVQLDREVAIKIPTFGPDDGPEDVERFYREARAMATLSHPNLCPVYDVGEIDGVHYLTMQFVEGRPMDDFLKGGKSHPAKQVAAVLRKLAVALEEAHQAGVIHRDLKPANIMLDKRNEPIIMDFGLAQRRKENETTLTQAGQIMGTPSYMSPEQVKGKQDTIGPPSDVYALGVICYQLLTGKLPFTGSLGEVMAAILTEEPERPSKLNKKVDRSIEAICLKAMAKDIGQRYASAAELAKSLRDYLRGKRLPEEDAKLALPRAVAIEPTASVNTTGKEVALADDFFADLVTEETRAPVISPLGSSSFAQLKPVRRRTAKPNVPNLVWIASGSGVGVLLLLIIVIAIASSGGSDEDQVTDKTGGTTKNTGEVIAPKTVKKSDTPAVEPVKPDTPSVQPDVTPPTQTGEAPPQAVAPFDAAAAKAHQEARAKYLGEPVETTNSIGMKLVVIPPGEFKMGDPDDAIDVTLTKPFRLGIHEVTQGQWKAVMETEPWKGQENVIEGENVAATFIGREGAVYFCHKLTNRERAAGRLKADQAYRLPTDAEWEWACRAGTNSLFTFGDEESEFGKYAWYRQNTWPVQEKFAHPVGLKLANSWGLYDIHGNVSEWCADRHANKLSGGTDPAGPDEGSSWVFRGGNWDLDAWYCRASIRYGGDLTTGVSRDRAGNRMGFRVALSPSNSNSDSVVGFPKGVFHMTTKSAEDQGLVLDSDPLTLKARADSAGMAWKAVPLTPDREDYFRLTSEALKDKNLVLEGSDEHGAAVMTDRWAAGTRWKAVPAGEGYYYLTTAFVESRGKVLDSNVAEAHGGNARFQGTPRVVDKESASPSALWKFIPAVP